jgi:predicted amidohydrolase
MKVKIGVVQPKGFMGEESKKQQKAALAYIEQGGDLGVKILCFPEWYPGPVTAAMEASAVEDLCAKAREQNIYVIAGGLEKGEDGNSFYTSHHLVGPDGNILGTYRRTTSAGPHVYDAVFKWGNMRLRWGNQLPVFETEYGNVGILFCSEVYTPELARVIALKGADIIFFPSGGLFWTMRQTWRNLVWARAIENLVYTAMCSHIYGCEEGLAMITGPEGILAESAKEGILTAEVDLDRVRWLRDHDACGSTFMHGTNPGKSSGLSFYSYEGQAISRRPELYTPICMDEEELRTISIRK